MIMCRHRGLSILLLSGLCFKLASSFCQPHWCHEHGHCSGVGDDAFCLCNIGYKSSQFADCDIRVCPKGDDPLTTGQDFRTISLKTRADSGTIKGKIQFSFNGHSVQFNANANGLTEDSLARALKQMTNIEHVRVARSEIDENGGATYGIVFLKWPTSPHENNVYSHDGNPTLDSFSCDTSEMIGDGVECLLDDLVNSNIVEYATCSNHGTCDEKMGKCICDAGWRGTACDDNRDDGDVQTHVSNGPFFAGNVLKLKTYRAPDESFNFINVTSGSYDEDIFTLKGNGDIIMKRGDLNVSGSAFFAGEMGVIIETASTSYKGITASSPIGGAALHGTGNNFSSSVLYLYVDRSPSDEYKFLEAVSPHTQESVFEVGGNGRLKAIGGIDIPAVSDYSSNNDLPQISAPRATIGHGGILLSKGNLITKDAAGIEIGKGGALTIQNGSSSFTSSSFTPTLTLSRNLENIPSHSNSNHATLMIQHHHAINENGQFELDGVPCLEIISAKETVFKIESSGRTEMLGGLNVNRGGISVSSGGIVVDSGGLDVHGGLTLHSGNLNIRDQELGLRLVGGGIESTTTTTTVSAFVGRAINPLFGGTVVLLEGPDVLNRNSTSTYNFISATHSSSSANEETPLPLFSVASNGAVHSSGGVFSKANITAEGILSIRGGATVKRKGVRASDVIKVDVTSVSFIEISDDGAQSANMVILDGFPEENQLLLVKNSDQQPLSGDALQYVPPFALLLYVYTSHGWVEVTASAAHKVDLTGITRLEAVNDINIGKHALSSGSILVTSKADSYGQLTFFGNGGTLSGDDGASYNPASKILKITRLSTQEFIGDALEFNGGIISNVALVNATIEGLHHLTLGSIGILTESTDTKIGKRMAIIDDRGGVSTAKHVIWDEARMELKTPAISSLSSTLEVQSDLDLNSHTLRNALIEEGTIFRRLAFEDGVIENSILRNVTADDLKLGSVKMKSVVLTDLSEYANTGTVLGVGNDGHITANDSFRNVEGVLSIEKAVQFVGGNVDLNDNKISNAHMISGSIKGSDIDIEVRSVITQSIALSSVEKNEESTGESFVTADENGELKKGSVIIADDGSLGDFRVSGGIEFVRSKTKDSKQGSIQNALIVAGNVEGLESLEVIGETSLGGGLNIRGETFIEGSLTVSGSVLGSGPYVDLSDVRFKKNVKPFSGSTSLEKLMKIQGVTYELNLATEASIREYRDDKKENNIITDTKQRSQQRMQIGFIAQEVESVFPDLVETRKDGFKGLQYARFVPVIVEGLKELNFELQETKKNQAKLQEENESLRLALSLLTERITRLEREI